MAEALAEGDYVRGKKLVSTTYGMMFAIFVPLTIILELLVPVVDWSGFLNVSSEFNGQLIAVMRILVFCFALQMIFNTITAIWQLIREQRYQVFSPYLEIPYR